jgi:hypothetical protein
MENRLRYESAGTLSERAATRLTCNEMECLRQLEADGEFPNVSTLIRAILRKHIIESGLDLQH